MAYQMRCHHEGNIRLEEAMTKELDHPIRVWSVQGLHVEVEGLSENTKVQTTFVYKDPSTAFELEIAGSYEAEDDYFSGKCDDFSTLEELKERHPNLFEMEGTLFAFP